MSIKEMTLLDVIELSNRMDAASRDVSACGALRPAQRVSQRSCRFPAWFHPGITPLAPRLGPARSRSLGVDCTCCDRSFASSAVARDRRAA